MTKEERKEYKKAYYESHKESEKAKSKAYYQLHKEQIQVNRKEYLKAYRLAHKEHKNSYTKAYNKTDVNSLGQTKKSIRQKSWRILKQMNLHIPGYETHHCFGYDDPTKFIYISKSLHSKIHQYLRDNNIDADSNHWLRIRDMVLHCNEYFYAKM